MTTIAMPDPRGSDFNKQPDIDQECSFFHNSNDHAVRVRIYNDSTLQQSIIIVTALSPIALRWKRRVEYLIQKLMGDFHQQLYDRDRRIWITNLPASIEEDRPETWKMAQFGDDGFRVSSLSYIKLGRSVVAAMLHNTVPTSLREQTQQQIAVFSEA